MDKTANEGIRRTTKEAERCRKEDCRDTDTRGKETRDKSREKGRTIEEDAQGRGGCGPQGKVREHPRKKKGYRGRP
ncbi:hypothetical protein SK128_022584 [Halocaridina rubra]|uniref:Uncharacterized protein n=1 Tax=Halocaridina rubra TaxID=373956 RepID=A0AAN8ZU06_HALRR